MTSVKDQLEDVNQSSKLSKQSRKRGNTSGIDEQESYRVQPSKRSKQESTSSDDSINLLGAQNRIKSRKAPNMKLKILLKCPKDL